MDKKQIEVIKRMQQQVPEAFGKPATKEEILNSEKILGVELPKDYKTFLSEFGAGGVGTAVILGLSEAQFLSTPSFVDITLQFRNEFKYDIPEYEYIVVIGEDGMGNPIGFLPNEPVIFTHDHNFGGRYDLADNFCDYINKALDGTLQVGF